MRKFPRALGTIARVVLWSLMAVILLVVAIIVGCVNILSPERLTPMVQKIVPQYLNADIRASRIEFSLLGHMPFLRLDIDSLVVLPHTLDSLTVEQRAVLPQWADTLAKIDHFHVNINIFSLRKSVIDLKDIVVSGSTLNLVAAQDSITNFEILKPTAKNDTASSQIPAIKIDRFLISNPGPIRYFSIMDTLDVELYLSTMELDGNREPTYGLKIQSNVQSPLLNYINSNSLAVGLNGGVIWDQDSPNQLQLQNFYVGLDSIRATIDTQIDFQDELTVRTLEVKLDHIDVPYLLRHIPEDVLKQYKLSPLKTDARIGVGFTLNKPYVIKGNDPIPFSTLTVDIPLCFVNYQQLRFGKFYADFTLQTKGGDFDDATLYVDQFYIQGHNRGVDLSVSGKATNMESDAEFDGKILGHIIMDNLPRQVRRWLQAEISGKITLNTEIAGRVSYFNKDLFNKLKVTGNVDLKEAYYAGWDTTSMYYVDNGQIVFGTDKSFLTPKERLIKGMLMASVDIDSADILSNEISMSIINFRAGLGTRNAPRDPKVKEVQPIGGTIKCQKFNLILLTDSSGLRLRDIDIRASIRRFQRQKDVPQFKLNIDAGFLGAGSKLYRVLLSKAHLDVTLHPIPKDSLKGPSPETRRAIDSLRTQFPDLPRDSIFKLALKRKRDHSDPNFHRWQEIDERNLTVLTLETSKGFSKFIYRWDLQGTISAERAGFYTPYFPLRNRFKNINIGVSTDSIQFDGLLYKVGHSDFALAGKMSNIKRSLLTHLRSPIRVHLDLESDTVDVNQLAEAIFKGSAYGAAAEKAGLDIGSMEDENEIEKKIEKVTNKVDSTSAFVIPVNFEAELSLKANNIIYSNLMFTQLDGSVLLYDGGLNLHDLRAHSDMGTINLDALYSAPSLKDVSFSFGMKVKDFNIKKFYTLVPAIDTLMPVLKDFAGIINADVAATTQILPNMDINIPTMQAVLRLEGDSIKFMDSKTYRNLSKWLMFKNKDHNMIDHIAAEMIMENGELQLFPFLVEFDRYKLGIYGYNDLSLRFNYHIGVLKSPIPFKFGINITGDADDFHWKLGGCKFKEGMEAQRISIADTTRLNLLNEIQNVFRRGVRNAKMEQLRFGVNPQEAAQIDLNADTITQADSVYLIKEGLIPSEETPKAHPAKKKKDKSKDKTPKESKKKKKKDKK